MLLSKNQDNGGINSAGEQRAKCYASRMIIPHPVISALHYVRLIKSNPTLPPPAVAINWRLSIRPEMRATKLIGAINWPPLFA